MRQNRSLRAFSVVGGTLCLLSACGGGQSASTAAESTPASVVHATIKALVNQPPNQDNVGLAFLLTDGTVMAQSTYDYAVFYKLTPDASGSYLNGTWTQLASLPSAFAPDSGASVVLADGRVAMIGAEDIQHTFAFIGLSNIGAIYDPVSDTWTMIPPPPGIPYIGDSPVVVMPNGTVLLGDKLNTQMASFDPKTMQWTTIASTGKADFFAEEGLTLLPNGNVLTVDVSNAGHSEHYVPSLQKWISDGTTPALLSCPQTPPATNGYTYGPAPIQVVGGITYGPGPTGVYYPPGEIGAALLLPDGNVFATGATNSGSGHTALYHPGAAPTDAGTWTAGPDFPNGDSAYDAEAVLLPNGHVLTLGWPSGTLYEFDGKQMLTGPAPKGYHYYGFILTLPTGEQLMLGDVPRTYSSPGHPDPAWAPTITSYTATLQHGQSYPIMGTQFNGLSTGEAVGDEEQTNTNYPLVRITNNATGHVFYARTHDHSTMGVATGKQQVSTTFDVPAGAETGTSSLVVIANGIASHAVTVTVQ